MVAEATGNPGVDRLQEPFRTSVLALITESGGRVQVVSGWRSPAEQIELRRRHCGPSQYAIYDMPSGQCSPPTARPGTSKHEDGLAVDLGPESMYPLIARLAPKHGLRRTVAVEPWHYEPVAGGVGQSPSPFATIAGGVPSPGDVIETGVDIVKGATPLDEIAAFLADAGGFLAKLLDPSLWLRALTVLGGLGLVVLGVGVIMRDTIVRAGAAYATGGASEAVRGA